MAHRTSSSNSRHLPSRPVAANPSQARRAHKRRVRDEVLRHELELREHPPTREPEHIPRRVRKGRGPFWKIVRRAAMILLFLGVVELGVASLTAQPFQVRGFDITGCAVTDVDQVHDLSRPLVGQNWIRAGRRDIEQQIEKLPTVKSARVSRVLDWPPRLHVYVQERVPFAKVGAGEDWWVVDEDGIAFRRANDEDRNLYAVTSPKLVAQIGKALPRKEWTPVVEIAAALKPPVSEDESTPQDTPAPAPQEWSLRRIYFDEDGSAALRLSGGFHDETLVRLGGDHWDEKIARARQALTYFERTGRRAAVLNLVSYEMPQWTPRLSSDSGTSDVTTDDNEQLNNDGDNTADTRSET